MPAYILQPKPEHRKRYLLTDALGRLNCCVAPNSARRVRRSVLWHCAYNWGVLDTHDLPDDVANRQRLVRQHRLEIEHLKIQLSRLWRWKFDRSREQLGLEFTQLQMSLQGVQEPAAHAHDLNHRSRFCVRARTRPLLRARPNRLGRSAKLL